MLDIIWIIKAFRIMVKRNVLGIQIMAKPKDMHKVVGSDSFVNCALTKWFGGIPG